MYKNLLLLLFAMYTLTMYTQTNAPSIQNGVTFQWSDTQTNSNQPATIQSVTVSGNVYFTFGTPTTYEMTQLGPGGHNINKIRLNGVNVETSSASATWNQTALEALQSLNLNYYFEANGNGQNICDDYVAEETTNAQRQTLFYSGGIIASSSGVIAVTERNANNCYHIELFGIPEGGGAEQSLGETFVNKGATQWGFGGTGTSGNLGTQGAVNSPPAGSDYWLSDRVIENGGTIGIALFYLNDIAPTGSLITKATITSATLDNGDGKMFILTLPDQDRDGQSDVDDLDDDNDGIIDRDESGNVDPSADDDSDGLPNYKDPDFCTLNAAGVCANLDFDSDGIPNHFDRDSDNDGITDVLESNGVDNDKDGTADGLIGKTASTYGIPATANTGNSTANSDGFGLPDYLDLDSDEDGIPDNVEAQTTQNYDAPSGAGVGITDTNKDGIDDVYGTFLELADSDYDGIYDYLDNDSDNDGIPDIQENGMANTLTGVDTDLDGIDDAFEGGNNNDSTDVNDEINNPGTSILPDVDGDLSSGGDLDFRDLFDSNPPVSATIDFDGVNDFLSGDSFLSGLSDITIMAWVKLDASNASNPIAVVMGEDIASLLYFQNGNTLRFGTHTTSGVFTSLNGGTVKYDEWHHIAGSFSSSTGVHSIYLDGEKIIEQSVPGSVGHTLSTTVNWNGNFEVGRFSRNQANQYYFPGNIDEVRVLNKKLTDAQIQQMVFQELENYSGLIQGKVIPKVIEDPEISETIPWANLIAYYPMSEIKNNTTLDLSPTDSYLKLHNITTVQEQTAPLPFKTIADGDWSQQSTWLHGNVWDIEQSEANKDWNIVHVQNNVSTNGSHTNLGLIVDSNKTLTVNGDNKIENQWYLKLDGTIDLMNDSQLIQTERSDLVTSANGKIKRRQEGNSSFYWYNYWASPVGTLGSTSLNNNNGSTHNSNNTNYRLNLLKKNNGSSFEFTTALHETNKISTYWLYTYKNGVTYYDYAFLDPSTNIQPGVGYTQKGTGTSADSQQYMFEGKPNNGTIIVPVIDEGGNGSVPAVSKTDYLLGNPYASAIDLHEFIDDNIGVIDGTINLWQQWSGSTHYLDDYDGGYAQVNKLGSVRAYQFVGIEGANNGSQDGTKTPTRYLPVGQGFMTEIVADGNVVFKNSQRVFAKEADADGTYGNGSVFFRGGNDNSSRESNSAGQSVEDREVDVMQKMRLEFTSVNGPATRRELLLGFSQATSDDFDYGYDAKNAAPNSDDLTLILGDEVMNIQAYSPITDDKVVPLALKTSGDYNYAIKITETEHIPDSQAIFLKDNLTGDLFNLRNNQAYEFSSGQGEFNERLEIVFQDNATLSQVDHNVEDLSLYYALNRNKIVVLNPKNKELLRIEVYNMLGQSVYKIQNVFEGSYNEYELQNLSTGSYIIKLVAANNSIYTKKILVK